MPGPPRVLLTAAVAGMFVTAIAADRSPKTIAGWGEVVNPLGDCKFKLDGKALSVAVPGTKHDLCVERGDLNAPRVLKEVSGDFVAEVKVSGNLRQIGLSTSTYSAPFHAAGLLLWADDRTYLRLERAALFKRDAGLSHYANFVLRVDGELVRVPGNNVEIPEKDTFLRLERRGNRVTGSVSADGTHWKELKPYTVELPEAVKVGVAAVNTSTAPLVVEFSKRKFDKVE